jgi:dihydroneopterin aldolase
MPSVTWVQNSIEMNQNLRIELKQLRFFGHHGYHDEEKRTGNEFVIDLFVDILPVSGTITGIGDTINYVTLFDIVHDEMLVPRALLETLAMEITEHIHRRFPETKAISIRIEKTNPPIPRFRGAVAISYSKSW